MAGAYPVVLSYKRGPARNRDRLGVVGTRVKMSWSSGVNEITLMAHREAATDDFTVLAVCFGAPNDSSAEAWLNGIDSENTDSGRVLLKPGVPRTFYFSGAGITRVDMKRVIGGTSLTVNAEAV